MIEASRSLSNISWKGRVKQVLFLMAAVLVGVVISYATDSKDIQKAKKSVTAAFQKN